jgi:hypothetical protein
MQESTNRGGALPDDARPAGPPGPERAMSADEREAVKGASAPATAAAGAVAGATAGMIGSQLGPVGAIVGAIVGALGGAAAGAAGGAAATGALYDEQSDAYYRALWDGAPHRRADRSFEAARPAFQYGHVAAQLPEFADRDFADVEPELRRRWPADLRSRAGDWELVRRDVETGYGHARSRGLGALRDTSVVGSAGSAVDPNELARARSGMSSRQGERGVSQASGPSDAWEGGR